MFRKVIFTLMCIASVKGYAGLEQYLEAEPSSVKLDDHLIFEYPPFQSDGFTDIGAVTGWGSYGGKIVYSDGEASRGVPPPMEEIAQETPEQQRVINHKTVFRLLDSLDNFFNNFFSKGAIEIQTGGRRTTYFDKEGNKIQEDEQDGSCIAIGSPGTCKKVFSERFGDKIVLQIMPLQPLAIKLEDGSIGYTLVTYMSEWDWLVVDATTGPQIQSLLLDYYLYERTDDLVVLAFTCETSYGAEAFPGETWRENITYGYQKWTCGPEGYGNKWISEVRCNNYDEYEIRDNICKPHRCDGYEHGTRFLHDTSACTGSVGQYTFKTCTYGTWEYSYQSYSCGGSGGSGGPGWEEPPPGSEWTPPPGR